MQQPLKICALIPTYNNANTIVDVIRRTYLQLQDIIVVADGCTDNTLELLSALEFPITLVSYTKNRGKGGALKAGLTKAKELGFEYALTLDADGQHYPEDIPQLIHTLKLNPHSIIMGSRQLEQENMPGKNTFANRFSNFWFRVQTGLKLPDTQTGMRIYPLDRIHGLRLMTSRYESELELLVFSAWANVQIVPVPIRVYYPPKEERVSHFKPIYDFTRISILNTFLCILAIFYGLPRRRFYSYWFVSKLVIISTFLIQPAAIIWAIIGGFRSEKGRLLFHKFVQWGSNKLIHNVNSAKYELKGLQYAPKDDKPIVYICNHTSLLDILALLALTPKLTVIVKDWVRKNPVFGLLTKFAGFLPISNGIEENIEKLKEQVRQGYSILVFPEGTRTATGEIGRFHRGAFLLAEKLGLDIQPMLIRGAYNVLNRREVHIFPGEFSLEYLPRVTKDDTSFGEDFRKRAKSFELYYRNLLEQDKSASILGAGVGGLFTAALLAKAGYCCKVYEQLPVAGGGLYSYQRLDEWWQTGMHTVCGLGENGAVRKVLNTLEINIPIEKCEADVVHGNTQTSHFALLYGGENVPQATKDTISTLFADSSYRFIGGTRPLTDALCQYITRHGGRIMLGEKISAIEISSNKVIAIHTNNNGFEQTYQMSKDEVVISSLHPKKLIELTSEAIFKPATIKRIQETKETFGSFKLHIKFKAKSFAYLRSNHYFVPQNILCYTQPTTEQEVWARTMEVILPLDYQELTAWKDNRKEDYERYEQFKEQKAKETLDIMQTAFPNIRDCIEEYFTSTSLTYRDDYLSPEGAMYGISEPIGVVTTRCENLYLTGQNCHIHGLCGCIMTAEEVVEKICARN